MRPLNIFMDYAHSGATRALFQQLCGRLHHNVWIPSEKFNDSLDRFWPDLHNDFTTSRGYPALKPLWGTYGALSLEEFRAYRFDLVIFTSHTRAERFLEVVRDAHPIATRLCLTICAKDTYEWDKFDGLIATEFSGPYLVPDGYPVITHMKEIAAPFHRPAQSPSDRWRKTLRSYVSAVGSFITDQYLVCEGLAACPHCGGEPGEQTPLAAKEFYAELRRRCRARGYRFGIHGAENVKIGGDLLLNHVQVLAAMQQSFATVHHKVWEGYGQAIVESLHVGRPVLIPKDTYRYKLGNRFLIDDVTAFQFDPTSPDSILDIADRIHSIGVDKVFKRCYDTARALFDWDYEAHRLNVFLREVVA